MFGILWKGPFWSDYKCTSVRQDHSSSMIVHFFRDIFTWCDQIKSTLWLFVWKENTTLDLLPGLYFLYIYPLILRNWCFSVIVVRCDQSQILLIWDKTKQKPDKSERRSSGDHFLWVSVLHPNLLMFGIDRGWTVGDTTVRGDVFTKENASTLGCLSKTEAIVCPTGKWPEGKRKCSGYFLKCSFILEADLVGPRVT